MNSLAFGVLSLLAMYVVQPSLADSTAELPSAVVLAVAAGSAPWLGNLLHLEYVITLVASYVSVVECQLLNRG